jgi:hypothetical protein
VVVAEGLEDVLHGSGVGPLEAVGYPELLARLAAWGLTVVLASQTPCDGYAKCTPAVDGDRTTVNAWLSGQTSPLAPFVYFDDFSAAVGVADGTSTTSPPEQKLGASADAGDHVNLSDAGCASVAGTIGLGELTPVTPPGY